MELKNDGVLARAGNDPTIPVGLASARVPAILGIWAMRLARTTLPGTIQTRLFPGLIFSSGPGWSLARLCPSALQSYRTNGASRHFRNRTDR
ncbi:MAG: hypothetical protein METHP_00629 [Methanoregula sp. SKADARSKE-2]|nr:MAG: hypothetical protein METHP_00629 [Methanoregula sp. SKADARSKE-2]